MAGSNFCHCLSEIQPTLSLLLSTSYPYKLFKHCKAVLLHRNDILGTLDFTGSLHKHWPWAPLYFFLEHSLALQLKLFSVNPQSSPLGAYYLFEACLMAGRGGGRGLIWFSKDDGISSLSNNTIILTQSITY